MAVTIHRKPSRKQPDLLGAVEHDNDHALLKAKAGAMIEFATLFPRFSDATAIGMVEKVETDADGDRTLLIGLYWHEVFVRNLVVEVTPTHVRTWGEV